jgi:hypothetical protein
MKFPEANNTGTAAPGESGDDVTGLPGLRSWVGVYIFVLGCFIFSVVLLIMLSAIYSS